MTAQAAGLKAKKKTASLAEAVTLFMAGQASENDVARSFLSDGRVVSLITSTALSKQVASLINDLIQDALVLFHEKYLIVPDALKLPHPDSVYSLVFAIGEGVAQTKRREQEQNKHGFISLDDTNDDDGEQNYYFLEIDDKFEREQLKAIDIDKGSVEWAGIRAAQKDSPLNRLISDIIQKKEDELARKPEAKVAGLRTGTNVTEERLTEDQRRLKEIRKEIGLTLENYATYLSITQASLSAYIYGRTDTVPADVMQTAETLFREHSVRFEKQKLQYEGKSMDLILDDWCAILEMDRSADEKWVGIIAQITGVRPVTVRRWVQEKYRPTVRKLIEYGVGVEEWVKAQSAKAAERGLQVVLS